MNWLKYQGLVCCLIVITQGHQERNRELGSKVNQKNEMVTKHNTKKMPEYLIPCKISDPNISQCLMHSINRTVNFMRRGMEDIGIRKIEPVILEATSFNFTVDGTEVQAFMNKSTIVNLSYFDFRSARIDGDCYIIELTIRYARLEANGSLVIPNKYVTIVADGNLTIEGEFIDFGIKVCGEEIKDSAKNCRYHFNKLDLQIRMDNFDARIECDNKLKGELVNFGLRFEKGRILRRVLPEIKKLAKPQFLETIQKLTDGLACEDIRPR